MGWDRRRPTLATALATAVFLLAAGHGPAADAQTRGQEASEERSLLDLRVTEGKLTGAIERQPISEVLEALRRQAGFEYEADDEVLEVQVSRRFEAVPLTDAIVDLLRSFNYTMTLSAEGAVQRIRIEGLSGEPAEVAASASARPEEELKGTPPIQFLPSMELTEAQLQMFERPDPEAGVPEELYEQFYPDQPPGSEETGPTEPETAVMDLPDFTPVESDTGPTGSDMSIMDLPEFSPFETEPGPTAGPFGDQLAYP